MLLSATTFALKLFVSSFQGIRAVGQVLGYTLTNMSSAVKTKVNWNSKHLTKGDPLPPFNGKLRLYNMRFCPFAQRVVMVLNAKNIDYEVVNIHLFNKPEWLPSKSPFSKVPALEIADGISIYESLVIVEYLDDAYPQNPLLPKDPVKKAFSKLLLEATFTPIHSLIIKLAVSPEAVTDEVVADFHKALDMLQNHLQKQGSKFLDGEEPGYVDYMLWPWFERQQNSLDDERLQIDDRKYKVLLQYIANMWTDPIVKEYAVPKDILKTFCTAFGSKTSDFDLLLEE